MKEKTHIAEAIDSAKEKAAYDDYVKNILSNKYILAHILQGTVEECKDMQSLCQIIMMILKRYIRYGYVQMCHNMQKIRLQSIK